MPTKQKKKSTAPLFKAARKLTDREIVRAVNDLAAIFYAGHGYAVESGFRFDEACHPQELAMWRLASEAMYSLTGVDADDALSNLEE